MKRRQEERRTKETRARAASKRPRRGLLAAEITSRKKREPGHAGETRARTRGATVHRNFIPASFARSITETPVGLEKLARRRRRLSIRAGCGKAARAIKSAREKARGRSLARKVAAAKKCARVNARCARAEVHRNFNPPSFLRAPRASPRSREHTRVHTHTRTRTFYSLRMPRPYANVRVFFSLLVEFYSSSKNWMYYRATREKITIILLTHISSCSPCAINVLRKPVVSLKLDTIMLQGSGRFYPPPVCKM